MRGRWFALLLCLSVCLPAAVRHAAAGDNSLRVNEAATQVLFSDAQTTIALAVENDTGRAISARLQLELIDPNNRVRAVATRTAELRPGADTCKVPLAPSLLATLTPDERRLLMWYRLHYRVSADTTAAPPLAEGILSVSRLQAPDLFELHVAAPLAALEGHVVRTRVRAVHPLDARPAAGVRVAGELTFENDEGADLVLKTAGTTTADGYAALDFTLPAAINNNAGELKITARRGDFEQTAEGHVYLEHAARILISTDKPLYQPGQTLHVRALIFDPTRHALADTEALLTVSDPDDATVFRAPLRTSRFGVASADWQLPDSTRLGDYSLKVEIKSGRYADSGERTSVRVSRYELPNFTVNVKPDRTYYLSGQNADVEVRADYLFGEPVKRGHVRVVRETERKWNYREQRWDIEEGDKYAGETDAAGRFVAHVNLKDEHEDFADDTEDRFRDLRFAVYFTDPTTNRTEQRRFDLRLTRDPVHVYVIEGREQQAVGLPMQFYVSTSYADGTPAECTVAISGPVDEDEDDADEDSPAPTLRTVRTDKHGLAKVSNLPLPPREDETDDFKLRLVARDERGQTGRQEKEFYVTDAPTIRVATDKALYRAGEPVRVEITANRPELKLFVDVAREYQTLNSIPVELHNGRASLTLPYTPALHDEITVAAYAFVHGDDDTDYASGWRTVLFPRPHDLQLDVQLGKDTYRPGETAHAALRVRGPQGAGAESALGVVIYDSAVEERARTDEEFGRNSFAALCRAWRGADALAGYALADLNRLDMSKPTPPGVALIAEILLREHGLAPQLFGGLELAGDEAAVFNQLVAAQLALLRMTLDGSYAAQAVYPRDEIVLRNLLLPAGVDFNALRDPWGTPYRLRFSVVRDVDVLEIVSAGADKVFGTADDFTAARFARAYFRFTGEAITRAVARFHARTGAYVRDAATLKAELLREGVDFDALRDPWGQPYRLRFDAAGKLYLVIVESGGPDAKFEPSNDPKTDDFKVWTTQTDYSVDLRAMLESAFARYYATAARFPATRAEFDAALAEAHVALNPLRDPWGHAFYVTFRQDARYADSVVVQSFARYGEQPKERADITPVTQHVNYLDLRSAGPDGREGTPDDFDVATFMRILTEQSARAQTPPAVAAPMHFDGIIGTITGVVTDPNGAVIPGVQVQATHKQSGRVFNATTNDEGSFALGNLPPGLYLVLFTSPGFKNTIIMDVPVQFGNVVQLKVELQVGAAAETVEVTATHVELMSTSSATVSGRQINDLPINGRNYVNFAMLRPGTVRAVTKSGGGGEQTATPRLREYFPETLLWQPALETDRRGRAQVSFKLADNITTWKLAVFGSNADGEVGVATRELRAFQPFFVEHEPPRVLTEGDEIMLPVVLRNYLARAQTVAVKIDRADWFTLLTPAERRVAVPAGDAAREVFGFRTVSSVRAGKQRVTALGADESDAVEKPVSVHPDGEELAQTSAQLVGDGGVIEMSLPANAFPHAAHAELRLYPHLMTHVMESVEAILARPHGCAEQTISSSYPSLLVLRHYKQQRTTNAELPPIAARAERYLRAGYDRLLSYRAPAGGFTYWGRGDADLALTAYAVRFLEDARELMPVDEDVLERARAWLVAQQQTDGSWLADMSDKQHASRRTLMLTAYIARVLARHRVAGASDSDTIQAPRATPPPTPNTAAPTDAARAPLPSALTRALAFLARHLDDADEPYFIASYALAASDAGTSSPTLAKSLARLRALAKEEAGGAYWALETNTPFYGWGLAGRIETTALVVQALTKARDEGRGMRDEKEVLNATGDSTDHASSLIPHPSDLAARGLVFLLRNKDRYGVWLSTQATVNVLDALVALSPARGAETNASVAVSAPRPTGESCEVFVNGQRAGALNIPADARLDAPLTLDLTPYIKAGNNRVELRRASGAASAFAQVVTSYYVPWARPAVETQRHADGQGASALRLKVAFDKPSAAVGEEIICHVEAERVAFRGYGMLLAEIGLPPGADVDRASLERAMTESGWDFSSYDVLPDKLIVYLWPRAGGTRFTFNFRPRYGLRAQTAPSVLYDYYNPEARAVLAPTRFNISERAQAARAER